MKFQQWSLAPMHREAVDRLTDAGFPFYAGSVTLTQEFEWDPAGPDGVLQLRGVASGKKSEIWELRFGRCKEDVTLQLLAPLVPIISEHPELMFRKKETAR